MATRDQNRRDSDGPATNPRMNLPTSPVEVVQRQLDAYNARDLSRFVANYSDSVQVFRPPAVQPALVGKAQLTDFYATQRFNLPALNAELVRRVAFGNIVADHERIRGARAEPVDALAVYRVQDGLIQTVWLFTE